MQPCNLENEIRSTGSFLGRIVPKTASYEIRLWNNIGGGSSFTHFHFALAKKGIQSFMLVEPVHVPFEASTIIVSPNDFISKARVLEVERCETGHFAVNK